MSREVKPQVMGVKPNRCRDIVDDVADHERVELHKAPTMAVERKVLPVSRKPTRCVRANPDSFVGLGYLERTTPGHAP